MEPQSSPFRFKPTLKKKKCYFPASAKRDLIEMGMILLCGHMHVYPKVTLRCHSSVTIHLDF